MIPVLCFVGRHNAGKTTVLVRLLQQLKYLHLEAAIIKHSHHDPNPDLSDSGKLFTAGAKQVLLSTPASSLIYCREKEKPLEQLLSSISVPVDLILIEGYKESDYPKIEIIRREIDPAPLGVTEVIARVADFTISDDPVPCFQFGQEDKLTQFIVEYIRTK